MATDIRAIKALNDFPETPYEKAASQKCWSSAGSTDSASSSVCLTERS